MIHGHTSHIGVGTVIELFSGLVLDFVVLSNFCVGCESGPKESDPSYGAWKDGHKCQNSNKKAGEDGGGSCPHPFQAITGAAQFVVYNDTL
ncbi:hypothetical protein HPB49_003833 [Dermacentor silvarum]|uniref:Uncharacterized protein n=1 Tax=Dermacentor silvarum TaxID=543639 RepID=A0ACB8DU53_DERSI|nr:hypothetical protein HPB49_003833 [Dermacentor silvarum]